MPLGLEEGPTSICQKALSLSDFFHRLVFLLVMEKSGEPKNFTYKVSWTVNGRDRDLFLVLPLDKTV